jgi:hypothetical protein
MNDDTLIREFLAFILHRETSHPFFEPRDTIQLVQVPHDSDWMDDARCLTDAEIEELIAGFIRNKS